MVRQHREGDGRKINRRLTQTLTPPEDHIGSEGTQTPHPRHPLGRLRFRNSRDPPRVLALVSPSPICSRFESPAFIGISHTNGVWRQEPRPEDGRRKGGGKMREGGSPTKGRQSSGAPPWKRGRR